MDKDKVQELIDIILGYLFQLEREINKMENKNEQTI